MAKFRIIAAAALQIVGIEDGHAEAGDELGTIETDCEIGSLISCMNFGQVKLEQIKKASAKKSAATDEAVEEDAEAATDTEAAATDAPARTTRRRK